MNNGDMPAYPVTNQNGEPVDIGNGVTLIHSTGMTKRESRAAQTDAGYLRRRKLWAWRNYV